MPSVKAATDKAHREVTGGAKTFATFTTNQELMPIIDKESLPINRLKTERVVQKRKNWQKL